jgi:hypothetical protein
MHTADELRAADLGDVRLNHRLRTIADDLTNSLAASLPQATGAGANLTYRFFDNAQVHPQAIRQAHYHDTLARLDPGQPVLLPSDTTTLDFSSHKATAGLGHLRQPDQRGLCLHSTLALTPDGTPLGLVQQHCWRRDPATYGQRRQRRHKPTEQKESQRWLDAVQHCQQLLPFGQAALFIADREADFYDLLAQPLRPGFDVLVRAKARRRLAGEDRLLGQAIRAAAVQGTMTIRVPRQDDQPERTATLEVRFRRCQIQPPSTHPRRKELKPVPVTIIEVVEQEPPAGVKPLHWLLLTNREVEALAPAEQLVRWYALRWRCERYHYTLKSGCQVEQLQLETAARLERAVAVYSIVALRVLRLTYLGRTQPEASCTGELTAAEQVVLRQQTAPPGGGTPAVWTLREAVRRIARLGGYQGRGTKAPPPGVKVLWRGLRRLQYLVRGYELGRQQHEQTPT